jgi:hypothetical protein
MSRFVYHAPNTCPCRKKHLAAELPPKPGRKATREQMEAYREAVTAWRGDVCGGCGSSLMCPTLQSGCAFCLPEGLVQEVTPEPI